MNKLIKTGRLFFSVGIVAYGVQQIIIKDFRPQIVPGFPTWAHTIAALPIVTGVIMVVVGLIIAGVFKVSDDIRKKTALYLGFYFLALIIVSHIPYLLFVYPHKLSHLGSWGDVLKELAFTGGAFVIAGSFLHNSSVPGKNNFSTSADRKLTLIGRIFFCTTIILFGCNHFAYDISFMVPRWYGMPTFWSYFGGAALILSGIAILFKIYLKPVALLLALMLFLWFISLHVPNAIADPYAGRGNRVVSAFDALLFCGVALVLSQFRNQTSSKISKSSSTLNMEYESSLRNERV
ncbi:hypothetical protein [Segetibacter aerophilus]|uniref:DoxX family membrane protein n=1 Tax=Segetibacter aerophilus TaxID=670293 RepID=A0A512BGH7_9BACT|nr:hypothetical protein [Segetibacter aerophilus]GEO11072.1 hypothetical protein SAE01_35680 [Segetibacter aerophilus]